MIDVYDRFCTQLSLADFLVIMGEAVMGRTAEDYDASDPWASGTYLRKFRNRFKFGRTTVNECSWNVHLMPNPEDSCTGLEEIFVDNIYAESDEPWRMLAAINGAHTVGSAKLENSGYDGYWSEADQQGIFNNDYYKSIIMKGWKPETAVDGNNNKNQWIRSDLGADDNHK